MNRRLFNKILSVFTINPISFLKLKRKNPNITYKNIEEFSQINNSIFITLIDKTNKTIEQLLVTIYKCSNIEHDIEELCDQDPNLDIIYVFSNANHNKTAMCAFSYKETEQIYAEYIDRMSRVI